MEGFIRKKIVVSIQQTVVSNEITDSCDQITDDKLLMTDNFNILSLIPQRPPFVMVEKLLYADDKTCSTSFIVLENNVLVCDGYFTEAGLMENVAQTVAASAGYKAIQEQTPVAVGYIAAIKNFEVYGLPKINDELVTEINFKEQVFNMRVVDGTVRCADKLMATCEMKIFVEEK